MFRDNEGNTRPCFGPNSTGSTVRAWVASLVVVVLATCQLQYNSYPCFALRYFGRDAQVYDPSDVMTDDSSK